MSLRNCGYFPVAKLQTAPIFAQVKFEDNFTSLEFTPDDPGEVASPLFLPTSLTFVGKVEPRLMIAKALDALRADLGLAAARGNLRYQESTRRDDDHVFYKIELVSVQEGGA